MKSGASGLTWETRYWLTLKSSDNRCFGRSACSPPSVNRQPYLVGKYGRSAPSRPLAMSSTALNTPGMAHEAHVAEHPRSCGVVR